MKLYYHPISTTSRTLLLFAAEAGVPLEMQIVDLLQGEHVQEPYAALNPNRLVPMLEDAGFRLTESSAIMKYLAEKTDSPLYPKGPKERARIHERMDWVNTQLSRELCYGVVYPQVFSSHKRRSDEAQAAQLEWSKERAQNWLKVLNDHILLGEYLCGQTITIADYFAAPYVALGELTGSDFSAYPNVKAWLGRMKALHSWNEVFEVIEGFSATLDKNAMAAA